MMSEELKSSIQAYQEEIKCVMGKPDAKKNDIVLGLKEEVIQKHPQAGKIMENVTKWNSWYLFRRIKDAFRYMSWYDSDVLVDFVWQGIGKIVVTLSEEPDKPDSKDYEIKKWKNDTSKLILKLPLVVYSYQMCFSESELVSLIKAAALQFQPEAKMEYLRAVSTECRIRWGSLYNFQRALDTEGLFWVPKPEDKAMIEKCLPQVGSETVIKSWRVKYIRKSGF